MASFITNPDGVLGPKCLWVHWEEFIVRNGLDVGLWDVGLWDVRVVWACLDRDDRLC